MNQSSINDPAGEHLSALMDGELPPDQLRFLLRRIENDAALPARWSRYQLARAALRRQPTAPLRTDFADVLMQRLHAESAPVAHRGGRALRWLGGGAIAASVAVLALVLTQPAVKEPVAGTMVAAAAPAAGAETRAALPALAPMPAAAAPAPLFGPGLDVAPAAWEVPYGKAPYGAAMNPYSMPRGTPLLPIQPAPERKPVQPAAQP